MMWSRLLCALAAASTASTLSLHEHRDGSFSPDAVLRVQQGHIKIGGIEKSSAIVNGSTPGPTIRIPEDRVVWIRVYNDMQNANLTMHWHGLAQAAAPFSDGTPLASQWPIPPAHFFDYELKAERGSAGTYFYHSHIGAQSLTVTGPLIVEDTGAPPYKYDGDKMVFLQELWKQSEESQGEGLLATPGRWPGEPNTWIINGRAANNERRVATGANEDHELAVYEVEPHKTYRFRFVASTALSIALLAFEGHNKLDIIQADAEYTKPHAVDMIQLGSGQRFDALLRTKTCEELQRTHRGKLDYYMQLEGRDRPKNVTNYAILRYKNTCGFRGVKRLPARENPKKKPLNLPGTIYGYLDYKLQPLSDAGERFPTAREVTRRVVLHMQQLRNHYQVWSINNASWSEEPRDLLPHTHPDEPYLVSMYKNQTAYLPDWKAAVAQGGLDPGTKTYPARVGEVVEVVLQQVNTKNLLDPPAGASRFAMIPQTHPWHAHGAHYWDAGGGAGQWDEATAERRLRGTRPVKRDTTMVYGYGKERPADSPVSWRVWRMRITQPGVWLVHCHTLSHMIGGMQTVWVHGDAKDLLTLQHPAVDGYLKYGGSVYGNEGHDPKVLHFHDQDARRGAGSKKQKSR